MTAVQDKSGFRMLWFASWLAVSSVMNTGCAVQYYSRKTGVEHLWGFGHLRLKAPPPQEGIQAIVAGQETLGFSVGSTVAGRHLAVGWRDERRIVVNPTNASVRFEWPDADFFKVRVGSQPPFLNPTNSANPRKSS